MGSDIKKMYWSCHGNDTNFGDMLGPYLYMKFVGYSPEHSPYNENVTKFITVGSIITSALKNSIVWGSGIMNHYNSGFNEHAEYVSIRGPYTAQALDDFGIKHSGIYGDPCLLLPQIYNPVIDKQYRIGVLPHIVEYDDIVNKLTSPDILVINLNDPIESVIIQLLSCEKTIASSLHGNIVSNAYNIPCSWIKLSNKLDGDGVKFLDHFASIGLDDPICLDLRYTSITDTFIDDMYDIINPIDVNIDLDALMGVCPFN